MSVTQLIKALERGEFDRTLRELYMKDDIALKRERLKKLLDDFLKLYGDREAEIFSVPGRTELLGNHTDHNGGCVLAASVDIDIIAVASKTDGRIVKIKSEGYREDVVDIDASTPENVRRGHSDAIIAGIADYFRKHGYKTGGFCAYTTSDVMSGSGLSSSAAFEVMCARIFSGLYNGSKISKDELALAGKYAENVFFGKPCGLMDQAACAAGGCIFVDFSDPERAQTEKLSLDLSKYGYKLCIVNTGGNHADLTDDYASVPAEMKKIASLMGKSVLSLCDEEDFLDRISYLRSIAGDRAVMRALHFFEENKRVKKQRENIKKGDMKAYFETVSESGNSSFKFLQNVYTVKNVREQGLSLALAVTEKFGACCRVHGGGFAGTIQAYIKENELLPYVSMIESVFGKGSCMVLSVRKYGASLITRDGIYE